MNRIEVIESFYSAFQSGDKEQMVAHYHPEASFRDPAFGPLKGEDVKNMWRLLIDRADGHLKITYSDVREDGDVVRALSDRALLRRAGEGIVKTFSPGTR